LLLLNLAYCQFEEQDWPPIISALFENETRVSLHKEDATFINVDLSDNPVIFFLWPINY